jgi:hypothetical protein
MNDTQALLPIKKGDNFMLGPYHFVCMGWHNGRIIAMTHDKHGFYEYSLSMEVVLSPGFRMLSKDTKPLQAVRA